MRNLAEYPITKQEILDCLDGLINIMARTGRYPEDFACGDMRPLLLQKAKEIVERSTDI